MQQTVASAHFFLSHPFLSFPMWNPCRESSFSFFLPLLACQLCDVHICHSLSRAAKKFMLRSEEGFDYLKWWHPEWMSWVPPTSSRSVTQICVKWQTQRVSLLRWLSMLLIAVILLRANYTHLFGYGDVKGPCSVVSQWSRLKKITGDSQV